MRELLRILIVARGQQRWIISGIALSVGVIAANSLLMALSGWFITSMAIAGVNAVSFNYFFASGGIRFLAISRTFGRYIERLITHEAAFRVLSVLRVWLFRQLAPLAPAGLEHYAGGDVAGRLRVDVDALENLYLRIVLPIVSGIISILLGVVFVSIWSSPAAIVVLIFLLIAGVAMPILALRLSEEPGRLTTELAGELRIRVAEGLIGIEELVLLGAVERQAGRVEQLSSYLVAEQKRMGRIGGLTLAGSTICGGFGVAAVLLVGSNQVISGMLSGPSLVMLLLFTAAVFEAASQLPSALYMIPAVSAAARRILELADACPPISEPDHPQLLPESTGIVFRNVYSSYNEGQPVLTGFNLEVAQGTRVALTGPSGVGKSTVSEILLRFRSYSGSVTIGSVEICDLAADDLYKLIAVMPQKSYLFNTTIRENILLGNPFADDDIICKALYDAGLTDWITSLPLGLDTPVGEEGHAVSGGEARRIALARTLIKDAPIMILDEPTEGLDTATERDVVSRLAERTKGKTLLVITHRPACLALADRIINMELCRTSQK